MAKLQALRSAAGKVTRISLFGSSSRFTGIFSVKDVSASVLKRGHLSTGLNSKHVFPCVTSRWMCSSAMPQHKKEELQKKFSNKDFQHFRVAHKENQEAKLKTSDTTMYTLPHPIWSEKELSEVQISHRPPKTFADKLAYYSVQTMRTLFDFFSGYKFGKRNEQMWLRRIIFLETVAGVPGMVAAMVRHLHSLRRMKRDHGWIHTLLEEAENERMHLMTALKIKQPGRIFKWSVIGAQGVFVSAFSVAYLISPRFCHRFVGYLEEEAVVTYSKCLQDFDKGNLKIWEKSAAPPMAIQYWKLPPDAMMRDVIEVIRADEAHHRTVNHTLGSLDSDDNNPFEPGK